MTSRQDQTAATNTVDSDTPSRHADYIARVRLTEEERKRYLEAAHEHGLSLSSLMRMATNTYLRSQGM
jgi:hypothetical protein